MGVVVWFQLLRLVRMVVRAVLSLMLVFVLLRIACVGMLVRMQMLVFVLVDVVVFVGVRGPIVGVLMGMRMSVLMLVLVAMIVLAFHQILLQSPRRVDNQPGQPNLSATLKTTANVAEPRGRERPHLHREGAGERSGLGR